MPTPTDLEEILAAHELATGTLRTVRELCDTHWADDRQVTVAVSDRGEGTIRIPNAPWRFAGSHAGFQGEPRYRGEDNRQVLGEILGLDDAALDRLEAEGVLSSRLR